jgi:hypothetical protein
VNIWKYAVLGGATVGRDVEGCDQSTGLLPVAPLSADEDCIIYYIIFSISVIVHFVFQRT